MKPSRIPQARIALNWECRKRCIYCTPQGEAGRRDGRCEMSPNQIRVLAGTLAERGVSAVKLTGGDPLWRDDLVEIVQQLGSISGLKEIELVTKAPHLRNLVCDLHDAGLTGVTISLDSLNREKVQQITGVDCLKGCLDGIVAAREVNLPVVVNMVTMAGINDDEIPAMIEYTARMGARLKLLDLIRLPGNEEFWQEHFMPLNTLCEQLEEIALRVEMKTHPGGIGHPMRLFHLRNGAHVLIKDATVGAWYGDICLSCSVFPCIDAITSLWITPDGKLKRCLTCDDRYVDLMGLIEEKASREKLEAAIKEVLRTYMDAQFLPCPWTHLIPQTNGDQLSLQRQS